MSVKQALQQTSIRSNGVIVLGQLILHETSNGRCVIRTH